MEFRQDSVYVFSQHVLNAFGTIFQLITFVPVYTFAAHRPEPYTRTSKPCQSAMRNMFIFYIFSLDDTHVKKIINVSKHILHVTKNVLMPLRVSFLYTLVWCLAIVQPSDQHASYVGPNWNAGFRLVFFLWTCNVFHVVWNSSSCMFYLGNTKYGIEN